MTNVCLLQELPDITHYSDTNNAFFDTNKANSNDIPNHNDTFVSL